MGIVVVQADVQVVFFVQVDVYVRVVVVQDDVHDGVLVVYVGDVFV